MFQTSTGCVCISACQILPTLDSDLKNHLCEACKAKERSPAEVIEVPTSLYFQVPGLMECSLRQRESETQLPVL